jgi:hypothetical protein
MTLHAYNQQYPRFKVDLVFLAVIEVLRAGKIMTQS